MQLNPVDQKEVHFIRPGNPYGTYSEMLMDKLFEIVKDSDFLIDLHAGEMAQALMSWVPVPMRGKDFPYLRNTNQEDLTWAKGLEDSSEL